MDFENVSRVIKEAKLMGADTIVFTGGEPLMYDRLSELVLDEEDYMQNVTEKAFTEILIEQENTKIVLNLKKFNQQEHVIKTRIIMQTTKILFGTSNGIEKKHVEDIIKLCGNNIGNKFLMPNKYYKISVKGGKVSFEKLSY